MLNGTSADFIDENPTHDYSLHKRMGQRHLKGIKREKNNPVLDNFAKSAVPQTQAEEVITLKRQDEKEKYHHDGRQRSHVQQRMPKNGAPQVYTPGYIHQKSAQPPSFNVQLDPVVFVPVITQVFSSKFRF